MSFETRPAITNADVKLHTELRLRLGFSAHDWSDPRLAQTDDPILDALGAVSVHFFLLRVDRLDCGKLLLEFCRQCFSTSKHFLNMTDVPAEKVQLLFDCLTTLLYLWLTDAGVRSVVFMSFLTVCARLLPAFNVQLINDFLVALAGFVE